MRGKGTFDPSLNPNSYPMTDTVRFPSAVRIRVNGAVCGEFDLPDNPADHRGILSWHAPPHDRKLREAGSYGYLETATLPHVRHTPPPPPANWSSASKWMPLCLVDWRSMASGSDATRWTRRWC